MIKGNMVKRLKRKSLIINLIINEHCAEFSYGHKKKKKKKILHNLIVSPGRNQNTFIYICSLLK